MTLREMLYEAWLSIRAHRLRVFLTMLGIIIGIGSVTLMVGIGAGSRATIEEAIASLGSGLLIITPTSRLNHKGEFIEAGVLTTGDMLAIGDLSAVAGFAPSTQDKQQPVQVGGRNWQASLLGSTPAYFSLRSWEFADGASFTDHDAQFARRVAVLGASAAAQLFPGSPAVGEMIRISGMPFEVTGVLKSKGQSLSGRDQDNVVILPFLTMQRRINGARFVDHVPMITVRAHHEKLLFSLEQEIRSLLRERHRLREDEQDDFQARSLTAVAERAKSSSEALSVLLGSVAGISLVVGGIGIMNMMLVSVTERTREIGIRKALGATRRVIMAQFLCESLIISLTGSLIGLLTGLSGMWIASSFFALRVEPTLWSLALSAGVALVVGLFFGFYPARRAAALNPVEALRYQ